MIIGLDQFEFEAPWTRCDPGLEIELKRELSREHMLYGVRAVSVAQRTDCDDVLFQLDNFRQPFAVVHLTWSGKPDLFPQFPSTTLFDSFEAWVENCMKLDSADWNIGN
jgi:hypothetical protein